MIDVRISDLLKESKRPLLSFEFFPPKDDVAMGNLKRTAHELLATKPDFVTCTYGAGGSTRLKTLQVCDLLREIGFGPVMPHLTCVGSSQSELRSVAREIYDRGYRNIMTLRGDPPKGDVAFHAPPDGLSHAGELVALLKKQHPDFCCGVAAYPEAHPEAISLEADIARFKQKLDLGADFGTTQLFFDNKAYFDFVERCRVAHIHTPIIPGLLPVISLMQVQRMCQLCKATLPPLLAKQLEEAGGDGEAAELVGIRWAEQQISELLEREVPGIHLYILNRSKAVLSKELVRFFQRARP